MHTTAPSARNRPSKPQGGHALLPACLAMGLVLGLTDPVAAQGQSYDQSFQGIDCPEGFRPFGPGCDEVVRFQADGLRIMIPPDLKSNGQSTGVRSTFGVAGDFEITVSFEVLAEPPPPNPYKRARFTLTICPASPDGAEASMSHRLRMKQAADFQAWNRLWSEKSKKNEISSKFTPTKVKAGRFRLVRNGTTLQYYASEGDKGEFALLHKCSFPDSDLTQLVISAAAEEPGAALGVRVHDLRIRGKSLPNLQAQPVIAPVQAQSPAPVAQPSAPSSEGKSHIWLIAALAIGLVLCALALLALVLLWRRAAG